MPIHHRLTGTLLALVVVAGAAHPASAALIEASFRGSITQVTNPDELLPETLPDDPLERRVTDYLAGMTDRYALQLYEDLFFPDSWPV